jgi:MFS family permease
LTRSTWGIMWAAFSAGVLATIVQFSVPPILPLLKNEYQVTYTDSALLMSLFALATVISAVPGGFIVQRYGVRKIGLFGLGLLFIGIIACLLANSYSVFLLGRIIEGIGFGLVSVAAPSAIGQYVPPKMMSVAMGIWSTWVPLGGLIMFLFAPKIVLSFGISVYWVILLIILVGGFLFYAKVIPNHVKVRAEAEKATLQSSTHKPQKDIVVAEIKNKNIWWAALAFASFTFAFFSFNTWITTYLTETTSMNLTVVALIPSLVALLTMTSNVYSGFLLKKLGNHLVVFLVPALFFIVVWPIFTSSSFVLLIGNAIILGLFSGFIPTIVFACAPLIAKKKESIGIAMSIVIIGENVGVLIGPEVFGVLREWTGDFKAGFWSLSIASLFMLIASIQIWRSGVFGEKAGLNLERKESALPEEI